MKPLKKELLKKRNLKNKNKQLKIKNSRNEKLNKNIVRESSRNLPETGSSRNLTKRDRNKGKKIRM